LKLGAYGRDGTLSFALSLVRCLARRDCPPKFACVFLARERRRRTASEEKEDEENWTDVKVSGDEFLICNPFMLTFEGCDTKVAGHIPAGVRMRSLGSEAPIQVLLPRFTEAPIQVFYCSQHCQRFTGCQWSILDRSSLHI
jgi:hypothetical protein